MEQHREEFVEPEIIRHEEKVADVTANLSSRTDLLDDTC
jgi:hypothetical protein